jgi:DNA-binding transcriptional LysR family regulator
MLYSLLLEHNQAHRNLVVEFTVAPNPAIIHGVANDRFDIGFVSSAVMEQGVFSKKIYDEPLLLVLPSHARVEGFADLVHLGFISHPDGPYYATSILEANFEDKFTTIDVIPVRGFVNQLSRILDPVAGGLGFTVLPEHAVRAYHQPKKLRPLSLKRPSLIQSL